MASGDVNEPVEAFGEISYDDGTASGEVTQPVEDFGEISCDDDDQPLDEQLVEEHLFAENQSSEALVTVDNPVGDFRATSCSDEDQSGDNLRHFDNQEPVEEFGTISCDEDDSQPDEDLGPISCDEDDEPVEDYGLISCDDDDDEQLIEPFGHISCDDDDSNGGSEDVEIVGHTRREPEVISIRSSSPARAPPVVEDEVQAVSPPPRGRRFHSLNMAAQTSSSSESSSSPSGDERRRLRYPLPHPTASIVLDGVPPERHDEAQALAADYNSTYTQALENDLLIRHLEKILTNVDASIRKLRRG
ncbi:hypothetical protein NMY22_g19558 [Coprinellus aureogranulatus]|nr:hypothetical protein NMY22_g19558 [Coprinellus aureogranulatus]